MRIVKIVASPLKTKRYRAFIESGDSILKIDFGLKGGYTFIDGASVATRDNYRKRHLASPREKRFIQELIPSPALLAYWLLWGDSQSIDKNVKALNSMLT